MKQPKDLFQLLNILTKFIGPAKKPLASASADCTPRSGATIEQGSLFLEKTDHLDRMKSHHDALQRAVAKEKIPAKLKIQG